MIRMILGSIIGLFGLVGFAVETGGYQERGSWDSFGLVLSTIFVAVGGCLFYFGRLARIRRRRVFDKETVAQDALLSTLDPRVRQTKNELDVTEDKDIGIYYRTADYAGSMRRACIAIVDGLVLIALGYALRHFWFSVMDSKSVAAEVFLYNIMTVIVLYLAILKRKPGTLGYLLFGVRIVDLKGRSPNPFRMIFRAILSIWLLNPYFLILDLLWPTGDENRQTLRDKLTGTYVVRKSTVAEGHGRIKEYMYGLFSLNMSFNEVSRGRIDGE